ncbi:outer membrane protein [Aquitalea sp. ASV15]|uniref:outer membrane protein n=1 Tax=Aquitalea sp. ASV15 TaxID=2795104 RepID=UPI0018EDDE88|nr:outer membrane beta-barrel protein [Aquitalea sp. ASV15]
MKKIVLFAALLGAASTSSAGGFDGLFAEAKLGYAHSKTDFDGISPSDNSTVGEISLGYSKAFGEYNLAGTAYVILGDQKAGSISGTDGSVSGTVNAKGTNTWGIAVEPGFNVNDNTLVYAKLGYTQTTGELDVNATVNGTAVRGSTSTTFNGVTFGAGAKYKFATNLYGVVEVQQTNYSSKDGVKPSTFMTSVGIGYKF